MTREEEIYFASRVLDSIRPGFIAEPKLSYPEEKEVVARALRKYINDLESQAYDIGRR